MADQSAEQGVMDPTSKARLVNTIRWASKAMQECNDLAYDAPVNPGLESLENAADEAGEALERLLSAARTLSIPPDTHVDCTCGHPRNNHDLDGCIPECGCIWPGPAPMPRAPAGE